MWFRTRLPFMDKIRTYEPVSGVGLHYAPNSTITWTNLADFWTISRTNSLGFVDREPASPETTAAGCHIVFVGDSFVEAKEVAIADKFHVRLEKLAAEQLPHWDLTTAAYGHSGTGQIAQWPYFEKWILHSAPKLVVLVFTHNDFADNQPFEGMGSHLDIDHRRWTVAIEDDSGRIALRPPPSPISNKWNYVPATPSPGPFKTFFRNYLRYPMWLYANKARRATISWPVIRPRFTDFALDLWQKRTSRERAALVVLATPTMRSNDDGHEILGRLAQARSIPVVDLGDYIMRQGAKLEEARWKHDRHWNLRGHRWAAEAMLEWLRTGWGGGVCGGDSRLEDGNAAPLVDSGFVAIRKR